MYKSLNQRGLGLSEVGFESRVSSMCAREGSRSARTVIRIRYRLGKRKFTCAGMEISQGSIAARGHRSQFGIGDAIARLAP